MKRIILCSLFLIFATLVGCASKTPPKPPATETATEESLNKLVELARSDIQSGKDLNAVQTLDAVIAKAPRNAKAFLYRGLAHYNTNNDMQAVFNFTRAIELDPTNPLGYFNRGTTKLRMQEFQEAKQDFTTCIDVDADFALALKQPRPCQLFSQAESGRHQRLFQSFRGFPANSGRCCLQPCPRLPGNGNVRQRPCPIMPWP